MPEMFLVKQGMVGDNFVHKPGDIIAWEATNEIPALLEAGILEIHQAEPPAVAKVETPEAPKSKKKESR
jgi:hypothetical protein